MEDQPGRLCILFGTGFGMIVWGIQWVGMKVTCCWRCFTDANAFGEPVQTHPKRSKSKIWGLSAIASHRESLATMISDPDAFPPPDFWMDFGFSWVVACWPDIPLLNIHH